MSQPPRLVVRTLAATLLTLALILGVTFVVLTFATRERVRAAETEKLEVSTRVFTALEARRQQDQLATVGTLTEAPTLKAALETYAAESRFGQMDEEHARQLRQTVENEVEKLASRISADVVAILDNDGRVFAAAGTRRDEWPLGERIRVHAASETFQQVVALPQGAFHVSGARLHLLDDPAPANQAMGELLVATSLDEHYAQGLSTLSDAGIVIVVDGTVVARTVPEAVATALSQRQDAASGTTTLNGEEFAVGTLLDSADARIYVLTSIDGAAHAATRAAMAALGTIALGSGLLAIVASVWLSRTLTRPIDRLATTIARMTAARDFERAITPTGTSRELDALANAFNQLVLGLSAAEAETRATYLGATQALAAALDARDPYTAGHSERVSDLSVLIARQLRLPEPQIDVIRLGALLHDVGKIGVPDDVLRKPGPLTTSEFEQIKAHPTLGGRILRQVPFLAPHLPIVELHHERPDGRGYPFGLHAGEIPLDARIVHVADAFDAMTSARAYRPARAAAYAVAELQKHVDTQFDRRVVEALVAVVPAAVVPEEQPRELLAHAT